MIKTWAKFPLALRLFVAFGVLMVLITLLSISFQAHFYKSARIEKLKLIELPLKLDQLSAKASLYADSGVQVSRILANDPDVHRWLVEDESVEKSQALLQKMAALSASTGVKTLFMASNDGSQKHYFQYENGQLVDRPMSQNNPDDAWYYDFVSTGTPYELHLDSNQFSGATQKLFINYRSVLEQKPAEPLLVAGAAIDMQAMADLVSQYRYGDAGFVSLVTEQGNIEIAAPTTVLSALQNTSEFARLLNKNSQAIVEFDHENDRYFVSSVWIENLQRFLVVEIPKSQLTAFIDKTTITAIGVCLLLLVGSLLLLYPLSRGLTRSVRSIQKQVENITDTLDLSRRIRVTDRAEVGGLASEVNLLLERMSEAIEGIQRSSNQLQSSASNLADTAGFARTRTDSQHSMVEAIEQMSSSVAEITSTMEELSASSTQIADHSQSVVDVASHTLESSQRGAEAMQELKQRMAAIHADYEQSLQDILDLGKQSKEISHIMDLINTLADQTRLIAFNAALEASSAGASGKRFSVVAGEIRRLADSVSESTFGIEERIQTIQASISRLVITSEKAANSVQAGMDVSAETELELNELVKEAARTSNAAQQISLSTRQQKTASSQVVVALRDIANASSHNAQSVRHISNISEELLQLAEELNGLVKEFNLGAGERDSSAR